MGATEVDVLTAAGMLGISPRGVEKRFKRGKIAGRFVEAEKGGGMQGKKLMIEITHRAEGIGHGVIDDAKTIEAVADSSPAAAGRQAEFLSSFSPPAPLLPSPRPSPAKALHHVGCRGSEGDAGALVRAYPIQHQRIFAMRKEALIRFRVVPGLPAKGAMVALWNIENPSFKTSVPSLYRLDAAERDGGEEALIPGWIGTERTSVADEPYRYFKDMYLTQQGRGAEVCRYALGLQFKDLPPASAFLRRLRKEIPPHVIYYHRYGPSAYDRKFGGYCERDYSTVASGQIYVMDHHQVDVAVMGRDGKPMFPWATVCADVRSRKYLGWVLCPQPNSDTIHLAFRRACLRFGVPREIYIDNGKDFKSKMFAGGVRRRRLQIDETATKAIIYQLGVVPHFALPYNAKSKPIERSFLTLKERFSRLLPTFRGGDVVERPEELQEIIDSGKIIPLAEFERLYAGFAEAVFNNTPHRGNGMDGRTPNEVFAEGNVARAVDEGLLSLLLYKTSRPLIVGKNGVTHWGWTYYADPLLALKGQPVYLRYEPDAVGRVWVYTMKDEFICQAQQRELVSWNATEAQLRKEGAERKKERRLNQSYHQKNWDRSKEPSILHGIIAKEAAEHGVDLSPEAMHPEKPLLAGMRMSQRERERMQEEDDEARQTLGEKISRRPPDDGEPEENPYDEHLKRYFGIT